MKTSNMKAQLFAITVVLTAGINPKKINFTQLALQPCEVCDEESWEHEIHRDRLFEVTISARGNINQKSSILKLEDRSRGVLIAPHRILSTADYFLKNEVKAFYAYYGYLEDLDDLEGFQVQKIMLVYTHPLYVPDQDEYNIAVSEVGEKFHATFAYVSEECLHFLEKPINKQCNIIGFLPPNGVRLLNVNMLPQQECMGRYRVLKTNTTLSRSSFCITIQNAQEIPAEVNVDGAPVICETTVHGLMLLHTHRELTQIDPIPVLYLGAESFWILSKALHLQVVHLTSAANLFTIQTLFTWFMIVYKYFYQNFIRECY